MGKGAGASTFLKMVGKLFDTVLLEQSVRVLGVGKEAISFASAIIFASRHIYILHLY